MINRLNFLIIFFACFELYFLTNSLLHIIDFNSFYLKHANIINEVIIPHSITAVIGALTATGIAYYFQKTVRREEAIKSKTNEIHSFNEAVIYSSAIFEDIMSVAGNNILDINRKEKNHILKLKNGTFRNKVLPLITLETLPSIQIPDQNLFLKKIPNVGKYPELGQAFYRLKTNLNELKNVADDRTRLVIIEANKNCTQQSRELSISNMEQINQRTEAIIFYIDNALNSLIAIIKKLNEIRHFHSSAYSSFVIKDLKVIHYEIAENQFHLIKEIENVVDNMPAYSDRFKHKT